METKDYIVGIDLGTTNSAIAIWNDMKNKPQIIKNRDNKSTTPSVVAMAYGEIIVGSTARNILKEMEEKGEAAATHKRDMGTGETVLFNGKKQPPYILASYLLQELRKIAEDKLNAKVHRAVITVPAYFPQTGVTDTKKAGEMAGFIVESLLPEPIAAALAYGKRAEEDTRLMVYDLGGGTFDVSILEEKAGEFIVHGNDGDRYLGGDDFDMLLRNHILKKAQYTYLLENELKNSIILQKLNLLAEDVKINLSTMQSFRVLTRGQYTDSQGKTIEIDLKISRDEFVTLIEPKIEDTIRYCNKVLKDAKLKIKDINEIILVGGSTKIPYITERLKAEFGIQPTQCLDPMTCVAEGAAIHTRSLRWILKGKQLKMMGHQQPVTPTSKKEFTITGKITPESGFETLAGDLSSAKIKCTRGTDYSVETKLSSNASFQLNIALLENKENIFILSVITSKGNLMDKFEFRVHHDTKAATNTPMSVTPVTSYAFSVGLSGKTKIEMLLDEQSSLPAEAKKTFALSKDGKGELIIPIFEGKDPLPERNRPIGEVHIKNLPNHLKKEDKVDVTFRMDEGRILHIHVEVQKTGDKGEEKITAYQKDRDHDENLDKECFWQQNEERLKRLEEDLDKKLQFVPRDYQKEIGIENSRLRQEAKEALKNQQIGQLEAKIEKLVGHLRKIETLIPDTRLASEFRENSNRARTLMMMYPDLKSVDNSTVDACIIAGEEAINTGNTQALAEQNKQLKRLLNRIYEDIRTDVSAEKMLIQVIEDYEKTKEYIKELIAVYPNQNPSDVNDNNLKHIRKIGEAIHSKRTVMEIKNEVDSIFEECNSYIVPAQEAINKNEDIKIELFRDKFYLKMHALGGLIKELKGE